MPPRHYDHGTFVGTVDPCSECHNHLILSSRLSGQMRNSTLNILVSSNAEWSLHSDSLISVYWSTVASRVVGVIQPFNA